MVTGKTAVIADTEVDAAASPSGIQLSPEDRLPVEPQPPDTPEVDPAQTLRELRHFQTYGASRSRRASAKLWPALLYRFRDLSRVRHDYPILIPDADGAAAAEPLAGVIDALLADLAADGDEQERLKRDVYRLEATIRSLAEEKAPARLAELWDLAVAELMSAEDLSGKQKQRLQTSLTTTRQALSVDGELLSCSPDLPRQLLIATFRRHWRRHCEPWRAELASLIAGLENVLHADFDRSAAARSPQHLRDSAGTAKDMDFDAMADILSTVHVGQRLPEDRRRRVSSALSVLLETQPAFEADLSTDQPFSLGPLVDDLDRAIEETQGRMLKLADFFRAVQIARLEADNKYRSESHDGYFERFDESFLSDAERALCPPVLVCLHQDRLSEEHVGKLLGAMASGARIKLLIQVKDLFPAESSGGPASHGWRTRLGTVAMSLNDVYVGQGTVAQPMRLQAEFLAGLSYGGPGLFNVYAGSAHSRLPRYLDAAAACESRAFPSFRFDPGRGDTQADRMDVQANSQPDRQHSTERFSYQTGAAQEAAAELAFTAADFLLCDHRLGRNFWAVPPAKWHEGMLPLQDWLVLEAAQAAEKIPYLTVVGASGEIGRVVPSRHVLAATLEVDGRWRSLQESGGIRNSFALRALAEERQRLEEEMARQVAAIEQEYANKLEQNIGALTEEIVARIAAQLTGDSAALAAMPLAQPVARAPAAPPPAADEPGQQESAAQAAEEIDEEPLTFDDPYIDTPLCTSCNECTDMNSQLFGYDENKQAYIKDLSVGTFRELVLAAEVCPVRIIHPGKPKNADEENLEEWLKRAEPFN